MKTFLAVVGAGLLAALAAAVGPELMKGGPVNPALPNIVPPLVPCPGPGPCPVPQPDPKKPNRPR